MKDIEIYRQFEDFSRLTGNEVMRLIDMTDVERNFYFMPLHCEVSVKVSRYDIGRVVHSMRFQIFSVWRNLGDYVVRQVSNE